MTEQMNASGTVSPDGKWMWNGESWVANPALGAPPAPEKKSRKGLKIAGGVLAALVALGAISSIAGGDSDTPSDGTSSSSVKSEDEAATNADEPKSNDVAGIGDSVSDGKFTFKVTGVKTDVSKVGDEYLSAKAQGSYTLVTMTVKNTGDEPQTFFADNVKGMDSQGRELSADSEASAYATDDTSAWLSEINPGNSIKVTVAFDVAKGETVESITVHDSAFSGGADIELK